MSYLDRFNWQCYGEGGEHKVVFLHGLMGSGVNWQKIVSWFPKGWEILTYDQRGHGKSWHPAVGAENGYRPEDFADDLEKILDELDWGEIFLLGHSMGGRNALNFAFRHPERVRALIIEDIAPDASKRAVDRVEFLLNLVPTPFANKTQAKKFFTDEFPRKLLGTPRAEALGQYFYTNIVEKPDGTASWRFSREGVSAALRQGRNSDRWQEVKGLRVPTLVIRGGQSDDLTAEVFEKMVSCNDLIEGVVVPNAGHWVHFDQAEDFSQAVLEFFNKNQH